MKESKPTSIFTFYAQYVRRKKVNILIGTLLSTSFIILFQTASKVKYIQNNIVKGKINHSSFNGNKGDGNEIEFTLEHCGCTRRISSGPPKVVVDQNGNERIRDIPFNATTCSKDAFMRGSGQKVVGFSFYGDINTPKNKKKGYFEGIVGNLELMPTYYPGWIMRLYYDLDDKDPITQELCNLACENPILDICNARRLPGTPEVDASRIFPMNWRFFPTLDEQVDVIVCRDLDSRINAREAAAVKEWREDSDLPIHSMRDNPGHGIGMVGASWGADMKRTMTGLSGRKFASRQAWKWAWKHMLKDKAIHARRDRWGPDQTLLSRWIWKPWGNKYAFQHDAYSCEVFNNTIGWPTQRLMEPNNFVASVVTDNVTLTEKCPMKCRRHPEWEYC